MWHRILLILFYLLAPYLILVLCARYKILDKIGTVVLCFIIGLLASFLGFIPENSTGLQENIMSITIPLAIPLLLFSASIKSWVSAAGKTMLSMIIALFCIITTVTAGYLIFGPQIPDAWKVGGMLIGLYTGGNPNVASIQAALEVTPELYIMTTTYDLIMGAIFLLIIMSTGNRLLLKFMPAFKNRKEYTYQLGYSEGDPESYIGIFKKANFPDVLIGLGFSVVIAAISLGLSFLFTGNISMLVVILSITTLSLAAAFFKRINNLKKSFESGMYLVLVFSIVIASMVRPELLMNISPALFYYILLAVFGSLILHIAISAIFRIDTDTTLITSTALICSPPFVPVVAGALKNKQVIISGLTVGILGYAIGNYLGVLIAYTLKNYV